MTYLMNDIKIVALNNPKIMVIEYHKNYMNATIFRVLPQKLELMSQKLCE